MSLRPQKADIIAVTVLTLWLTALVVLCGWHGFIVRHRDFVNISLVLLAVAPFLWFGYCEYRWPGREDHGTH